VSGFYGGRHTPTAVSVGGSLTMLQLGYFSTYFYTQSHDLYAWGENGNGQLGDGTKTTPVATPTVTPFSGVIEILAVKSRTACALRTSGTVACWGANGNGQVGDGTSGNSVLLPTTVTL